MFHEFNLFGIYVPWVLLLALLTFVTVCALSQFIAKRGLYRHVAHQHLFYFSLFFIVFGVCCAIFPKFFS